LPGDFRREYLLRLPLPLAQLYSRAYNAKNPRARHDNCYYLFEALIKLSAAIGIAAYADELRRGGTRIEAVQRQLLHLALPSMGQWVGMQRELARHFGSLPDGATHPLGHLREQLETPRRDLPGTLELFRRIKNGIDAKPAGISSVSLLQLFDSLVRYRNEVVGHGGPRFEEFFEKTMGPLLFPALNEVLDAGHLGLLGRTGARLVYLTEVRAVSEDRFELGLRELVGMQGERMAPLDLSRKQAESLAPNQVAVLWPGRPVPLRLDPVLRFRESEIADEVLYLNRDRNGRQVEYLSYTTGRTERDKQMAPAMAALLTTIAGRDVTEDQLKDLENRSLADSPSVVGLAVDGPARRVLGDYELIAEIGRGGMGVVYLARQLSLGRIVALKMLTADLAGDDIALARFRREMRALAKCEHPNIVKVLDSGTLPDGQLYFTMEYVAGCDLERVWRELSGQQGAAEVTSMSSSTFARAVLSASGKKRQEVTSQHRRTQGDDLEVPSLSLPALPALAGDDHDGGYVRRVVELARDAAHALHAVHEENIVHRDISPANLMLTPDGSRVVLMDFGLAKGETRGPAISRTGGFVGKLRYAAPEQLASAMLTVGPPADVRGLGVTLWELLTRERLFADAADERQLATLIHERDVPRLREIDRGFDPDLEAIVARATERRVEDRIDSAGRFAEYLELYLDGQPLPIRPPSTAEMVRRWIRDHKGRVATAAVALLAIVATVVVALVMVTGARDEAVVARDRALSATTDAIQARNQARAARAKAEENYKTAREVLDRLVTFAEERALDPLTKRAMLEEVISYQDRFIKERGDDPDLQLDIAAAYRSRAAISRDIESASRAEEYCQRSLAILRALYPERPADPEVRYQLARTLNVWVLVLEQTSRLKEAMRAAEQAVALCRALCLEDKKTAEYVAELGRGYHRIGNVHFLRGEYKQSIAASRRRAGLLEGLLKKNSEQREYSSHLAIAYTNIGLGHAELDKPNEAIGWYRKALALYAHWVGKQDATPGMRAGLGHAKTNLGAALAQVDKKDESALRVVGEAISLLGGVVRANPRVIRFRLRLAFGQRTRGNIEYQLRDYAGAAVSYGREAAEYEVLSRTQDAPDQHRESQAEALARQASCFGAAGRQAEALRVYRRSLSLYRGISSHEMVALILTRVAQVQLQAGRRARARESYLQAKRILEGLKDQDNLRNRGLYAWAIFYDAYLAPRQSTSTTARVETYERAIAEWERQARTAPDDREVLRGLAWALLALSQEDVDKQTRVAAAQRSMETWEKILRSAAWEAFANHGRVLGTLMSLAPERAPELLQRLFATHEGVLKKRERSRYLRQRCYDACAALVQTFLKSPQKGWSGAVARGHLESMLRLAATRSVDDEALPIAFRLESWLLQQQGRRPEADKLGRAVVRQVMKWVAADSRHADVLSRVAAATANREVVDESLEFFSRRLAASPDDARLMAAPLLLLLELSEKRLYRSAAVGTLLEKLFQFADREPADEVLLERVFAVADLVFKSLKHVQSLGVASLAKGRKEGAEAALRYLQARRELAGRHAAVVKQLEHAWQGEANRVFEAKLLKGPVTGLAFSSWGLAMCGGGAAAVITGAKEQKRRALTGHKGPLRAIALHPGRPLVVTAGDHGVLASRLDMKTPRVIDNNPASDVHFTGDGGRIVCAGRTGIRFFDSDRFVELRTLRIATSVTVISLSADGRRLAGAGTDGRIRIWDTGDPEPRFLDGLDHAIVALALTADGKRLVACSTSELALFDAETGRVLAAARSAAGTFSCLALSPESERVAVGESGRIAIYSTKNLEDPELHETSGPVRSVCWSAKGETFVAGSATGVIEMWRSQIPVELIRQIWETGR